MDSACPVETNTMQLSYNQGVNSNLKVVFPIPVLMDMPGGQLSFYGCTADRKFWDKVKELGVAELLAG